jgi:hypothetical protein
MDGFSHGKLLFLRYSSFHDFLVVTRRDDFLVLSFSFFYSHHVLMLVFILSGHKQSHKWFSIYISNFSYKKKIHHKFPKESLLDFFFPSCSGQNSSFVLLWREELKGVKEKI